MEIHLAPASSPADVRDRIIDHIKKAGFGPGDRIETERALQDLLGVSRSRVRDALAALEAQGVVTRRIGSGTYLTGNAGSSSAQDVGMAIDQLSPARLMEARMMLEVAILPIVVTNATNNDIKTLNAILDAADAAKTVAEFEQHDTDFHYHLAASAHNDLLSKFAEMVIEARRGTEWGRAKEKSATPPRRRSYQRDHRRILQAIRNRDLEEAVAAMKRHLISVQDNLVGS
jgi:DNA-binding FadR family transcriptional regulator